MQPHFSFIFFNYLSFSKLEVVKRGVQNGPFIVGFSGPIWNNSSESFPHNSLIMSVNELAFHQGFNEIL